VASIPRMTDTIAQERTTPDCIVEQDGHKLIVTMNRPERRNALSSDMPGTG
jgi:enoyl-CoA hydratase